jgi:anaerobic magnesium-protoporphyrin IX monomethyl ester cyclase
MAGNRRIFFVNPPYERIAPGYTFVKHLANRSPSLGLLHLAAQVREHGYEPTILESDILGLDFDGVADRIISAAPTYVGITLFTVGVWGSAQIARRVKQALPDTRIIVGGPHISSMGVATIERFTEFDVAVQGEGEKVLVELLNAYEKAAGRPADLSPVPAIIYRSNGQITVNPPLPLNVVLDELPFPAWDLLPDFPHAYKPAVYDYPRGPVATIAASRGCPFHCKFCDTSTFGASMRFYSPQKVFEMMVFLQERWGIRHIMFVDDLFLASRLRTTELCHLILAKGLEMTWTCDARVDTVKPDLLELMKKAGCWQICFGLETGSDEMLRRMDKSARVEKSERAVNWTAEAGIRVKGLFMLGYPGETPETIEMTKAFVRRIPMTTMNLTKFTPYPGSPVYRELYGTTIRDDHWEKMNGMNFVWSPDGISVQALDRHYQDVINWFYRQKRVRRRYLRESIRNPGHLVRLARAGVGFGAAKARSYLAGRRGLLIDRHETNLDVQPEPLRPAQLSQADRTR